MERTEGQAFYDVSGNIDFSLSKIAYANDDKQGASDDSQVKASDSQITVVARREIATGSSLIANMLDEGDLGGITTRFSNWGVDDDGLPEGGTVSDLGREFFNATVRDEPRFRFEEERFIRNVDQFIDDVHAARGKKFSKEDRAAALVFFKEASGYTRNGYFRDKVANDPEIAEKCHQVINRLLQDREELSIEDMKALICVKFALDGGDDPQNWREDSLLAIPAVFGQMLEDADDEADVVLRKLGKTGAKVGAIIERIPYYLVENEMEMLPVMEIALESNETAFIKRYLLESKALFEKGYRSFIQKLFARLDEPGVLISADLLVPMIAFVFIRHPRRDQQEQLHRNLQLLWNPICHHYVNAHWPGGQLYKQLPEVEGTLLAKAELIIRDGFRAIEPPEEGAVLPFTDQRWDIREMYPELCDSEKTVHELIGNFSNEAREIESDSDQEIGRNSDDD